ncbi:MAG: nucleotidyltransferase family protein [bacterium]|nr:nucleotidyltransferase family protein [bacterium]
MMNELEQIKEKLASKREYFHDTYGVEKIGIFGSFARDEARSDSDLDILITLKEPIGYFSFFNLEKDIQKLVERKVDVVTDKALKPIMKPFVMSELVEV